MRSVELSVDARVPILREYLRLGSLTKTPATLGLGSRDASDTEIRRSAPDRPVFRMDPAVAAQR